MNDQRLYTVQASLAHAHQGRTFEQREEAISFARQIAEQGWKVERITISGEVEDWDEAAA